MSLPVVEFLSLFPDCFANAIVIVVSFFLLATRSDLINIQTLTRTISLNIWSVSHRVHFFLAFSLSLASFQINRKSCSLKEKKKNPHSHSFRSLHFVAHFFLSRLLLIIIRQ